MGSLNIKWEGSAGTVPSFNWVLLLWLSFVTVWGLGKLGHTVFEKTEMSLEKNKSIEPSLHFFPSESRENPPSAFLGLSSLPASQVPSQGTCDVFPREQLASPARLKQSEGLSSAWEVPQSSDSCAAQFCKGKTEQILLCRFVLT